MKNRTRNNELLTTLSLILLIFRLFSSDLFPQEKFPYDIILEGVPIDDVTIDTNDRLIVLDHTNNLIRIFDSSGALQRVIEFSPEQSRVYHPEYSSRKLAVDTNHNIYCLTLSMECFHSIAKYDNSGKFIKEYVNSDKTPPRSNRIIEFYISKKNKIYLNTFPHGLTRSIDAPVFVYDCDFNFLGKVDYYIEDTKGDVYKFDKSQKDFASFVKFRSDHKDQLGRPSKVLSESHRVQMTERHGSLKKKFGNIWTYAGIDRHDDVYLTNGVVMKRLDSTLKLVKEYDAPLFELMSHNIIADQRNVRIGPSGSIFIFGRHRRSPVNGAALEKFKETSTLVRMKQ